MERVTPEKNEDAFLRWDRARRRCKYILWAVPLLFISLFSILSICFFTQNVPIAQGPEVLVLVTQVQEKKVPEAQVLEIPIPVTQLQEIQPGILEVRMPVTQWLSRGAPETPVLKPETRVLEIQVPVAQWLKRQVPEMQVLEIQVPAAQLQETQPETQWLGIQVPVTQLQEIQGKEALVLVTQVPESEKFFYLLVGICIAYCAVPIAIRQWVIKRRIGKFSKEACIFAAMVASEDLERGNPVRASLSIDKMLSALSNLLEQKLVTLGVSSDTPRKFMYVMPATIPRKAVFRAVQASEDTKDFQESLRNLAIGLRDNADEGYLAAHQFLVWLDKNTESYKQASKTFLDKRPTLRTVLLNICPVILPPLAVIVTAILVKW